MGSVAGAVLAVGLWNSCLGFSWMGEGGSNHPVEKQRSLRVDLVGALARRRVLMLLVVFLAPVKQDNKPVCPRAAPRLRLGSLASLHRTNL